MQLNYDNLVNVINVANGSERNLDQKRAESQLKLWESERGYHYLLQDVYLAVDLPLQVRWLAIICFKNGIDKYWRSSRPNAISREEKVQIRSRIFQLLHEQSGQLTMQNAHAVARMVRFDFPTEYPSLFDDISRILDDLIFKENDLVSVNNLLIILNQIIKTLALIRIGRAKHAMQSKSPVIVSILIRSYLKFFREWTSRLDLSLMEICYLCLKTLRRIIPEGFEYPHKNQDVVEFFKISVEHLQFLVSEHEKYSSDLLERYVKCYGKLYFNLINNNPTSFVLFPCAKDIILTFLTLLDQTAETVYNNNEENDFWEALALKGFLILKKIVSYIFKRGTITLKERNIKEDVNAAVRTLSDDVFTSQTIQHLCDLIINWYLRLRPSDLESWLLEPEEWTNEELSSSWEYQIRPCAENFYQDLISFLKEDISPFILSKISNGLIETTSLSDILTKDSILCTFQLSSNSIAASVDFDKILSEVLIPEGLRNDLVENKILKRRICLVIGEWVSVKCSRESRIEIYRLLIDFLNNQNTSNDKVVELTAIQTLRKVVEDWDFNKHDFEPYLKEFVKLMLQILNDMSFTESKLYILNTLTVLLEKVNPLIGHQILSSILEIVPQLWDMSSSENEPILQNSLLRLLRQLVIALNENSIDTFMISLPLIRNCCSESSGSYALLSEDGFDLWLAVLRYFPASKPITNEIEQLYSLIPNGVMNSTEVLPTLLSIMRSYALLARGLFTNEVTLNLFRILSGYLPNMRDDAFSIFISLMDILFLEETDDERFVNNLLNSGLLNALLNFVLDDAMPIVLANKVLVVLARLATNSSGLFMEYLAHLSIDHLRFFELWMKYYSNNGNPRNKKINLLAFLSLASYGIPKHNQFWMVSFPEVIKRTFLFLEEIQEDNEGRCLVYNQDFIYEDIDDFRYLDPDIQPHGEKRRYQDLLDRQDPVYKVNLKKYLYEILEKLKLDISEADFKQLIMMNDEYTIEKLQEFT
ncbi:uncharacterized protein PRCAT00000606001 [Priceomyces carsonii]|uniref:uncharacterized protein n=1 Tax=Priceomyces carsonii TaxID=28549 RepID=UPI002ED91B59|nr:unnamed protein product [Priceomyces carsonii]